MKKSENYVKHYDSAANDLKFITNSMTRLRVLISLEKSSKTIKDIQVDTGLSYSSISNVIHGLELRKMAYRNLSTYYLNNSVKLILRDTMDLKSVENFIKNTESIIESHNIDSIPIESVRELNLLENAELIQSSGMDTHKVFNFINETLDDATNLRCILPVFQYKLNHKLNSLVGEGKFVEIIVSKSAYQKYNSQSQVKYISSYNNPKNFLLIITNNRMILGLFREDGIFDQNRIITSNDYNALRWANNLFRYFKKLYNGTK